jgi:multiple sugar transport system substrate-binding protein
MRKLLIALTAVVVVGVGVWAVASAGGDEDGSGGGGGSNESAQVRFWVMNNGPDPVGDTEEIVRPFEKETGIDVQVQLVGWDVQFDRIRNAAVSGKVLT